MVPNLVRGDLEETGGGGLWSLPGAACSDSGLGHSTPLYLAPWAVSLFWYLLLSVLPSLCLTRSSSHFCPFHPPGLCPCVFHSVPLCSSLLLLCLSLSLSLPLLFLFLSVSISVMSLCLSLVVSPSVFLSGWSLPVKSFPLSLFLSQSRQPNMTFPLPTCNGVDGSHHQQDPCGEVQVPAQCHLDEESSREDISLQRARTQEARTPEALSRAVWTRHLPAQQHQASSTLIT